MIKFEDHELTITKDSTTGKGTVELDGVRVDADIARLSLDANHRDASVNIELIAGSARFSVDALALTVTASVRLTQSATRMLNALERPSDG